MPDHFDRFLEHIKQLEILDAKAWPARHVEHDGQWICRSTPDHFSGRLNSVTPMDPDDDQNIDERIERLCFENGVFVRPLRETSLMPLGVKKWLKDHHWKVVSDIAVYTADAQYHSSHFDDIEIVNATLDDYIRLSCRFHQTEPHFQPGFSAILHRAELKQQPLLLNYRGKTVGTIMAVWDGAYGGLMDYCIDSQCRGLGLGRAFFYLVLKEMFGSIKFPKIEKIWLQVDTQNHIACTLYQKAGFKDIYHYHYWRP